MLKSCFYGVVICAKSDVIINLYSYLNSFTFFPNIEKTELDTDKQLEAFTFFHFITTYYEHKTDLRTATLHIHQTIGTNLS